MKKACEMERSGKAGRDKDFGKKMIEFTPDPKDAELYGGSNLPGK